MFELRVQVEFPAAHRLDGYPGDCARPHGHNWVVEAFARSRKLDSLGIAIDFRQLKGALQELVQPWDHQDLNQLQDFRSLPPSAEQIAKLAFERLEKLIGKSGPDQEIWIDRVTVWENSRCSATYFEEVRGH